MSAPEVGLYVECANDEHIAYTMGWNTAQAINRSEAFAAIRRAAEVAREYDKRAATAFQDGDEVLESECWGLGIAARRAIRAAIRSDKP
jgi:hypothetical protein